MSTTTVTAPSAAAQKAAMKKNQANHGNIGARRAIKNAQPAKPKEEEKPKQRKQRNQAPKQFDARFAEPKSLVVSNSLRIDPITTNFRLETIAGISVEYVSRALQNGFATFASDPNNAYGAANWIYRTIQVAISGSTSQIQSGPLWLVEFCKAIAQKQARLGLGLVGYKPSLNVNTLITLAPAQPIGPPAYGYEYPFVIPSTGAIPVDGFPVADYADLSSDQGEGGWQELVTFNQQAQRHQEVSVAFSTEIRSAERSVSIFATNFDNKGGGQGDVGGYFALCGSETPVFQPILANMGASAQDMNVPPLDRTALYPRRCSGDSLWMTNYISQYPISAWENDRPAHFHSIDFLEFGTVLSSWITQVLNLFLADPNNLVNISELTDAEVACPLTLQEFLLLLRNEIMVMFKYTQTAVQGLYPVVPTGQTDNQFVAFLAAGNTCSISGVNMKLPTSIVENLRCLTGKYYKFGKKTGQWEQWIPILGKYSLDELNPTDYQFTTKLGTGVSHQYPTFAVNPQVRVKSFTAEGKEQWKVGVEQPIDLVDGYCPSIAKYLYINDPTRLSTLSALWNGWISQYEKYSDPLINVGFEGGPNALSSIIMTRHWIMESAQQKRRQTTFVDDRLKKTTILATPYDQRVVVADTSQDEMLAPTYESIQALWILPSNHFQTGTQPNNRCTLQQYQAQFMEPFSKVRSATGEDAILMSTLHNLYATKMTKASTSGMNDWLQAFTQASATGKGGLISGLIAQFAGNILGPQVGAVADTIASVIPF